MIELKLKVWDKSNQKFAKLHGITFDIKSFTPFAIKVSSQSWQPAEKFELLKWTGLCDNTGIDVYEGDIIDFSSVLYKVLWNSTSASFELIELESSLKHDICDVSSGKVISNIFENQVQNNS